MKNTNKSLLPVIRYFYGIAWRYEKPYFIILAVKILITGLSPFINIILPRYLIDELLGARRPPMLVAFVAAIVLLNLAVSSINNTVNHKNSRIRIRLDNKFDEMLAEKVMSMDYQNTEDHEVLTQLEKAKTGMSWYSGGIDGLSGNIISFISGIITFLGTVYIIGSLTPLLFAVLIAIILINMLITWQMSKRDARFRKELVGINRKFTYYFQVLKNFRYGKDIRIYNASGMILDRTNRYVKEDWGIQMKRVYVNNRFTFLLSLFSAAQTGLLYGYLGLRVLVGQITIGEFQMLLGATNAFSSSLSGVINAVITASRNADFMNDYRIFMLQPDKLHSGSRPVSLSEEHVLEFRNVSFKYPKAEQYSLRNISITLTPGRRLSIVGQNGAGKTTFIKLLCRLYDPTEGEILLDGVEIRDYDLEQYRRLFAVVFQDYRLLSFSIKDNISASASADEDRLHDAVRKAGFEERLEKLEKGADTPVYKHFDKEGVEFSGGESQKIAIARAIYKDAPVTVLDEPTAALDPMAEYDIYNRFNSLIGDKTAIYISHRLSSCRFCDSIAVFKDGSIVQYGPHDELVLDTDGEYHNMWSAQAQYYE